jgi:RNA polymerase sigma-70 factor (ECF subfamily)
LTSPDKELLGLARKHETQALTEIYDRYAESIYRYLYRLVGDAGYAEDLTSEVFVKLLQVLNTRKGPRTQLQGWLYRVAHNLAMDWFRQQNRRSSVSLNEELAAGGDSPPAAMERRQAHGQLHRAISQLTPDQQQVILLRFGEGLKLTEVAVLMDKSEGAIKVLQHRAVQRLRKLLEQEAKHASERTASREIRRSPATG